MILGFDKTRPKRAAYFFYYYVYYSDFRSSFLLFVALERSRATGDY